MTRTPSRLGALALLAAAALAGPVAADYPIPQRTVWLPYDGQEHPVGAASASTDLNWITTWAGNNSKGVLARTSPGIDVPPGDYVAVFQIFHKQSAGKSLGKLSVKSGGAEFASAELTSATFANYIDGGYQRGTVEFSVAAKKTNVTLEVQDYNNHYIWVGAISLQRKQKPFYVIGHHCSLWEHVVAYVNDGANAVEFDITPERNPASDDVAFSVYHGGIGGDIKYTPASSFGAYLNNISVYMAQGKLAMVIVDCKDPTTPDVKTYARRLAANLKKYNIPAARTVVSVPKDAAKEFAQAMKDNQYACGVDSYYEKYPSQADRDLGAILNWSNTIKDAGATFVGVGKDSRVRGEFYRYAYWLTALLKERDANATFKKVYFWTANTDYISRQLMDYGVDGILTDYPKIVCGVMAEAPYSRIVRKATAADSLAAVHGSTMVAAAPVARTPVLKNSAFILENATGRFATKWYSGSSYYYPQIGNRVDAEPFKFGGDGSALKPGDKVLIKTTNTGGMKSNWQAYDQLTTFKSGVGYWNYGTDVAQWTLEAVDGAGAIYFDAVVRIKNVSYNQYLYPYTPKGYLWTKAAAEEDTKWVIRRKP